MVKAGAGRWRFVALVEKIDEISTLAIGMESHFTRFSLFSHHRALSLLSSWLIRTM